MSTINVTNIKHPSSTVNNIVLASDGTCSITGGGAILSSGTLSGDGGSGSGTVDIATFTGLDFSAATANSKLLILARTATQEANNTSNVPNIKVQINVNGASQIQIAGSRAGHTHGSYGPDFLIEQTINAVITPASTYRTTNVRLIFQANLESAGSFYYGNHPSYNAFDGEGAGYQFSYILFSE